MSNNISFCEEIRNNISMDMPYLDIFFVSIQRELGNQ